jgi:hypothetical protein
MSEAPETGTTSRPWHTWLVGILALPWNAMGAFDYTMTKTKNEEYMANFTPEQLDFFYGIPSWAVASWALAVWGGLLGSVLLLMGRRAAAPVFLVSFVAMLITTIQNYALSNGMEVMGNEGLIFSSVIFLIALGLTVYSRAMASRGVLR